MAPTKVLNCSHGQALLFEYNQYRYNSQKGVRYVNLRLLDLQRNKSSFFKKNFVLYLTKMIVTVLLLFMFG